MGFTWTISGTLITTVRFELMKPKCETNVLDTLCGRLRRDVIDWGDLIIEGALC